MTQSKLANYERTLANLATIQDYEGPYAPVVVAGITHLFELAFEASWKLMKSVLYQAGYEEARTGSPKAILRVAYGAGMIHDEEAWLQAQSDRNLLAHTYDEEVALAVIERVKAAYLPLFEGLLATVRSEWL